jgi:hypothetical protein
MKKWERPLIPQQKMAHHFRPFVCDGGVGFRPGANDDCLARGVHDGGGDCDLRGNRNKLM